MRLISLLLLLATSATAAEMAVAPAEGVSVHPDLLASADQLLLMSLRDLQVDAAALESGDVDVSAKAVGASHVAQLRITRIGRKAIVQAELRPVGQSAAQWSGRLTASTPEDLDVVIGRLAKGIVKGGPITENSDIRSVTAHEAPKLRRKKANSYFGVTIAGQLLSGTEEGLLPGMGIYWLYDNRNLLLDLSLQFNVRNGEGISGLNIAAYYPLLDEDITPFLGGGLGFNAVEVHSGEKNEWGESTHGGSEEGITAFVGTGLLMGRTSSVALRADLKYVVATFEVDGEVAHGPQIGVGIGF